VFACPLCDKTYEIPDSLRGHVPKKHGGPEGPDPEAPQPVLGPARQPAVVPKKTICITNDLEDEDSLKKYNLVINPTYGFLACLNHTPTVCGFALTENWEEHVKKHKLKVTKEDKAIIDHKYRQLKKVEIPTDPVPLPIGGAL